MTFKFEYDHLYSSAEGGLPMATSRDEMITDIEGYIRKFSGGFCDWRVGTAKDSRGPFFQAHLLAEKGDGLIYREAFTADAAQAIQNHLVNDCGLALDLEDAPEPGKIVFVFRKTVPTHPAPHSDHPKFRYLAA